MFNKEEDFKFYVYEYKVFSLENALEDNDIQYFNENNYGTNTKSNKYYIKNSDRKKLDIICKQLSLEIFTDTIPNIETRFPKISFNLPKITLIIVLIILIFIILI